MARIYAATEPSEPNAPVREPDTFIRAIAVTGDSATPRSNELHVSRNYGTSTATFHTVLFQPAQGGHGFYAGTIMQPALGIEPTPISYDGRTSNPTIELDGVIYTLGEEVDDATIVIVTVPVMYVAHLIQTEAGYYVAAMNKLNGMTYDYLNGTLLKNPRGGEVRVDNAVMDIRYDDAHHLVITGDYMETRRQQATFDNRPATILNPDDYVAVFPDDLSTVMITQK